MARQAINVEALRRDARRRLPKVVFDYLDGGAEDETTLAANRSALDALRFRPRVLAGGRIDTATTVLDTPLALPLVVAPTGLNGLFWRQGDLCLARAAAAAGVAFTLSTGANADLRTVAAAVPSPPWFQLYPWGGPEFSAALMAQAAGAGCRVIVVTVDSLVPGNRERDRRNRFAHNVTLSPRIVLDGLAHPRWLASVWLAGGGMPRLENVAGFLPPGATAAQMADYSRRQRNPAFDWDDLARIRDGWDGRLVIKGILSPDDARRALALGCEGIVVSNHGGRQLDGAVATIDALPAVAEAVAGRAAVLMDGGIRRGADIARALARGADAVMVGRAVLYGLAAGGEAGAAAALAILAEEFARTMRLLGCRDVAAIGGGLLERA